MEEIVFSVATIRNHADLQAWQQQRVRQVAEQKLTNAVVEIEQSIRRIASLVVECRRNHQTALSEYSRGSADGEGIGYRNVLRQLEYPLFLLADAKKTLEALER